MPLLRVTEVRLTEPQRALIKFAASRLPPGKKELFNERIWAFLRLHTNGRPSDNTVLTAINASLTGLLQETTT
jgi:hypothetical protein